MSKSLSEQVAELQDLFDKVCATAEARKETIATLEAENAELRAGQGRWPEKSGEVLIDNTDYVPWESLPKYAENHVKALRVAHRELKDLHMAMMELKPASESTVPRVITAEELRSGAKIATFTDHGTPVAGIVTGEAADKVMLRLRNDGLLSVDTERTFILLEDAPEPEIVTAETIRASEPGSTWNCRKPHQVWEWDGANLHCHYWDSGLNDYGRTPEHVIEVLSPLTRSTAAPRGTYDTPPRREAFRRWHAAEIRKAKAAGWGEGFDAGWDEREDFAMCGAIPSGKHQSVVTNPYRDQIEEGYLEEGGV